MDIERTVSPEDIMADFKSDEAESIEDFPPEAREAVEGLLWLGYLEDEFEVYGHSFVLRTLRGDEELLASLISKEYVETLGQTRAWISSRIALALIAVDGDEEFCPPANSDRRAYARARFYYITRNWYYPVVEKLFEHYVDLERRQLDGLKRVEDLSTGNLLTSMPSASSSTSKGDSKETMEDIREFLDDPDSPDSPLDS